MKQENSKKGNEPFSPRRSQKLGKSASFKASPFKRGCLSYFIAFLLLYGLYAFFLTRWMPHDPVTYVLALFGTMGVLALVGSSDQILMNRKLVSAIHREVEGVLKEDGRFEAASGTIHPIQTPLVSPFQGISCVAYEYDIIIETRGGREGRKGNERSEVTGWALTPSVIKTARGDMRLLGWTDLEKFDQVVVGQESFEKVREYLRTTDFETIESTNLKKALSLVEKRIVDDDGSTRVDFRLGSDVDLMTIPLDDRRLTERVIPINEEISAFGVYTASQGGLIPSKKKVTEMVQLWPGKGEALIPVIWNEALSKFYLSLVVFIATHAFISMAFFIMWLKRHYE